MDSWRRHAQETERQAEVRFTTLPQTHSCTASVNLQLKGCYGLSFPVCVRADKQTAARISEEIENLMKEIETLVEEKKKDSSDMAKMIVPEEGKD